MKLEDFTMLKNIDISEFFGMIRHVMKVDEQLWDRGAIFINLRQGFKKIKCSSYKTCEKLAVAINKENKKGVCSEHAKFKDNKSKDLIKVTDAEDEIRDELYKLEKSIIQTEERMHFLSTNNICARPDDEDQKLLNDLYSQSKKQILDLEESLMKFSKTGEAVHYFSAKDAIDSIRNTSTEIIGKIAKLLHEITLQSFDKAVQNEVDLDSDYKYSDEESKFFKDQTPFPDDIYKRKLDLYTITYLLTQKVDFLQFLIRNLYKYAESTSNENKRLKAVRLILFFTS